MNKNENTWQDIGKYSVLTDNNNKFGTDAVLLEYFANAKKNENVVDIGTGCGIIPMLLKRNNRGNKVFGIDVQKDAINLFNKSIEKNALQNEVTPILCDVKDINALSQNIAHASIELVVSNPPYYEQNCGGEYKNDVRKICREEASLSIYDVAKAANFLLKFGGRFCVCYKPERLCDCIDAMRKNEIEPKKLRFVQKDNKSKPWLVLLEGKRGAKPFLEILPPLVMNSDEGKKELEEIYALN